MSCIGSFLLSIGLSGVNPQAYSKFVDYTTNNLLPADNDLAYSIVDLFTGLSAATLLVIVLLVLVTVIIIVVALVASGLIGLAGGFCIIAFVAACLAIYYAIGYTYSKKTVAEVALPLQQDIRLSTILIANSLLRDTIYLSLCA